MPRLVIHDVSVFEILSGKANRRRLVGWSLTALSTHKQDLLDGNAVYSINILINFKCFIYKLLQHLFTNDIITLHQNTNSLGLLNRGGAVGTTSPYESDQKLRLLLVKFGRKSHRTKISRSH